MASTKKLKLLLVFCILIIIILLLIVLYTLVFRPQFQAFVIQKQIEARDATVGSLLMQIQQQGYAKIIIGNQTVTLVPVVPSS